MKPALSTRQTQIVERIRDGLSNKEIARDLGISVRTVDEHIRIAAQRIGGNGWPRIRLALWFPNLSDD